MAEENAAAGTERTGIQMNFEVNVDFAIVKLRPLKKACETAGVPYSAHMVLKGAKETGSKRYSTWIDDGPDALVDKGKKIEFCIYHFYEPQYDLCTEIFVYDKTNGAITKTEAIHTNGTRTTYSSQMKRAHWASTREFVDSELSGDNAREPICVRLEGKQDSGKTVTLQLPDPKECKSFLNHKKKVVGHLAGHTRKVVKSLLQEKECVLHEFMQEHFRKMMSIMLIIIFVGGFSLGIAVYLCIRNIPHNVSMRKQEAIRQEYLLKHPEQTASTEVFP
jgi:hypothetical protein